MNRIREWRSEAAIVRIVGIMAYKQGRSRCGDADKSLGNILRYNFVEKEKRVKKCQITIVVPDI